MPELGTTDPASDGWIARHPVASFLLIGLPLALTVMIFPILAEKDVIPGAGLPAHLGMDMEEAASFLMLLVIFSTVFMVTLAADGRDGVQILIRRMTRWRVSLFWWLTAALAMPVGTIVLAVVLGDKASVPSASTLGGEVANLVFLALVINMMEETTWTGFLQTRLERRLNLFVAALIVAVPFAVVHLPLRIITGEVSNASELLNAFAVLMVLGVFVRVLFAMVLRGAANSILLVAITHTMFNRSNNTDGIAADVLDGVNRQAAALFTLVALIFVVGIAARRRLGRQYRLQLDKAEVEAQTSALRHLNRQHV